MTYSTTLDILEFAETLDLTVLETAKEELGIPPEDTSQDEKLTRWIHEVSGQINARMNRVLGRERVRETFDCGSMGHIGALPLSRYPVAQIDSLDGDAQTLTATDYRLDTYKGLLHRNYGRWVGTVSVMYSAGYILLGELPYDLERACLMLLTYRQSSGNRDPMLRSEAVPGVYEAAYWIGSLPGGASSVWPPEVEALLAPYRDVAI
jgi:hypothetical protein